MRKVAAGLVGIALLAFGLSDAAHAVTVDATSDIFAAGLSSTPGTSDGIVPVFVSVTGGETILVTATGSVQCCDPSSGPGLVGPNGFSPNPWTSGSNPASTIYANAGLVGLGSTVGTYTGNAFALVGVFDNQFGAGPFFIGANNTFVVPTGATELFLGFADAGYFNGPSGYYFDNSGSLNVEVAAVPEPSTWAMMVLGFLGLGFMAYRRKATPRYA
jgi:hypothetical protein